MSINKSILTKQRAVEFRLVQNLQFFCFFFVTVSVFNMAEGSSNTAITVESSHRRAFMTSLLSDFEKQEDCDIFFRVDGETIGAHKLVLKNTMRALFELDVQRSKDKNYTEIESMDFDTFKSLLR